jgi:hypothetical protein
MKHRRSRTVARICRRWQRTYRKRDIGKPMGDP